MSVLCIGTAVMDIMARPIGCKQQWEEKQRISDIRIQTGGDAANQSVYLAAFGCSPVLVACTGEDTNGRILRTLLEEKGVDTRHMRQKKEWSTGTAMVLVDEQGERHTFSVMGAHSTLCREDLPEEYPADCRAISLASLFSMPKLEEDGLLEYLQEAKRRGILIFADLAADKKGQGLEGITPFLPYIDYFLPSLYDVQRMSGRSAAEDVAGFFLERGVGHVVIKCGARGCCWAEPGAGGWSSAVSVKPVDTTGAGDCFCGVFISRILAGDTMDEACRFACAEASYSTLSPGASNIERTEKEVHKSSGAFIY